MDSHSSYIRRHDNLTNHLCPWALLVKTTICLKLKRLKHSSSSRSSTRAMNRVVDQLVAYLRSFPEAQWINNSELAVNPFGYLRCGEHAIRGVKEQGVRQLPTSLKAYTRRG